MIISNDLDPVQETQVVNLPRENKEALGWTLGDTRGISLIIVQHRIHLGVNAKP